MKCPSIFQKTRYQFHAMLAVTALAFGGLAAAAFAVRGDGDKTISIPSMADLKTTSNTFAAVTKKAAPAVVFIKVEKKQAPNEVAKQFKNMPSPFDDEMLKRFFGDRMPQFKPPKFQMPDRPQFSMGQGSGFIISEDGYILTNNHVVGGADNVTVTLADGREFDAKLVGADERSDVAVIKIDADGLPMVRIGNSDDLEVGEWVLAVGSPFGLPGTVTSGIVSAKGRSSVGITDYENFIQTDAAINPGNSGGPLLNLNGEAIGINTAIFSRSGGYMGIGFAIPINMARDICDQLIENGSVTRGYLGIAIQSLTPELAESFDLDDTKGVLIGDVTKDSPAAKAGLKRGDVIVEFDKHGVSDLSAFRNRVASTSPDATVSMTVLRGGEKVSLDVTIGTLPGKADLASAKSGDSNSLGMIVKPLSDDLIERYGYQNETGVIVSDVDSGSVTALAGIRPGSLIKEVNRKPVTNMDEFNAAMADAKDAESVLLYIKQGKNSRYVALQLKG